MNLTKKKNVSNSRTLDLAVRQCSFHLLEKNKQIVVNHDYAIVNAITASNLITVRDAQRGN